jgi:ankyrin repeat protein
MEKSVDELEAIQNWNRDAIFNAVMGGATSTVAALLADGVDPNVTWNSVTPLITAASRGHVEVVNLLLDYGADIDAVNNSRYNALLAAASENRPEVVRVLIERGADVERADKPGGNTALIYAASKGHTDVVRLLVDALADLDAKSASGYTSLYLAEYYHHDAAAQLLRDAPARQAGIIRERAEAQRLGEMHEKTASKQALLRQRSAAQRIKLMGLA